MQSSDLLRNKAKVALDIDGTLALVYEQMIRQWNAERGTNFTINDATPDNFHKIIGMEKADFDRHYALAWESNWSQIEATVSESSLKKLFDNFDVDIVTNRPEKTLEGLTKWLAYKFPNTKFNIVRASSKEKFDLDYDFYIEDGDSLADKFVENSGKTEKRLFLINYFCNKDGPYENYREIIRVENLDATISLLLSSKQIRGKMIKLKA